MDAKKIKHFQKFIANILLGKFPLILFDTSAIIHFEKKQKPFLEEILLNRKDDSNVLISESVMKEIKSHKNIVINAHTREIPEETYELVKKNYKNSPEIIGKILPFATLKYKEIGKIVQDFSKQIPQKRIGDQASAADIDFVTNALIIYSAIDNFIKMNISEKEKFPTSLIAFSGDERHIIYPLTKLRDLYFPYGRTFYIINSKEDKYGHYNVY